MTVTGVIQAGGKSRRMGGQPKALMELGGRRIIERVVEALTAVVDDVVLVTNTPELYDFLRLPMVGDIYPDHGSLGGIYSGLKAAAGDAVLTVACDMPFLRSDVVRLIVERAGQADVVIPRVGDELQPLHAVYRKTCLAAMEERLVARQLKILGFFAKVRVMEVPEAELARYADPAVVFMNVNTPDELARARALVAQGAA